MLKEKKERMGSRSKILFGVFCFLLGIGAMLLVQRFSSLLRPHPTEIVAARAPQPFGGQNPFAPGQDMSSVFRQFFGNDFFNPAQMNGSPMTTIIRREDDKNIYYELPIQGLEKDKLKVSVAHGEISISGEAQTKSRGPAGSEGMTTSSFH